MLIKWCAIPHSIKTTSLRSGGWCPSSTTMLLSSLQSQSSFISRSIFSYNNKGRSSNHLDRNNKYHSKSFHTQQQVKFNMSEKDFEKLRQQQQQEEQASQQKNSESSEQTQPLEQAPERKEAELNKNTPKPLSSKFTSEDPAFTAFTNPFYRDVNEKTDIEFVDSLDDKEQTPFPTWMMRIYIYAAFGIVLFVGIGILNNYREETTISERYKILEEKRSKRLEQTRNLQQEIDFHNVAQEKNMLKAIKSAMTVDDDEEK